MGIKEKQALYDALFMKSFKCMKIPRGSNKSFLVYVYCCHLYAMTKGNFILSSIGETLDGITTIVDA